MRFKTETKNRIQALKYRDGLENHQIAREMGISQTMIWQYIQGLEKQIEKGEITVADIVKSVNTLKIEGPKKVRFADDLLPKAEDAASNLKDEIAKAGLTADELAKNANEISEAMAKAGEPTSNVMAQGGIIKEPDGFLPIKKKRRGGRQRQIIEIDGEPANKKMKDPKDSPSKQSDYILSIMAHIYDELVAGKVVLRYYLMEDGVHELQFVEVKKK